MKMFYKVTVDFPDPTKGFCIRRSFSFASTQEADNFVKLLAQREGSVTVAGTSIDHLMDAREALDEIDEEIDLTMRAAHSEIE